MHLADAGKIELGVDVGGNDVEVKDEDTKDNESSLTSRLHSILFRRSMTPVVWQLAGFAQSTVRDVETPIFEM